MTEQTPATPPAVWWSAEHNAVIGETPGAVHRHRILAQHRYSAWWWGDMPTLRELPADAVPLVPTTDTCGAAQPSAAAVAETWWSSRFPGTKSSWDALPAETSGWYVEIVQEVLRSVATVNAELNVPAGAVPDTGQDRTPAWLPPLPWAADGELIVDRNDVQLGETTSQAVAEWICEKANPGAVPDTGHRAAKDVVYTLADRLARRAEMIRPRETRADADDVHEHGYSTGVADAYRWTADEVRRALASASPSGDTPNTLEETR